MGAISGGSYTLYPPDRDLGDLDHYRNYTWGMNTPWDITPDDIGEYEHVVGATGRNRMRCCRECTLRW
jgi:hypothetical protein